MMDPNDDSTGAASVAGLPVLQVVRLDCAPEDLPTEGHLSWSTPYTVVAEGTELSQARLGAFRYTQMTGVPHWVIEEDSAEQGPRILFRAERIDYLSPRTVH